MQCKKLLTIAGIAASLMLLTAPMAFAASGSSLFAKEGCMGCHTINGAGGSMGPDLSHVGSKKSESWLKKQITDPNSHFPGGSMPSSQMSGAHLKALSSYLESLK